jgi:hypothetical protein
MWNAISVARMRGFMRKQQQQAVEQVPLEERSGILGPWLPTVVDLL